MIENEKLILCEECGEVLKPRFTRCPEMCSKCELKFKEKNRNIFITLKEFIVDDKKTKSSDIDHPSFRILYMRNFSYLMDERLVDAIVVSSIEAYEEGKGCFNSLLKDIMKLTHKPIMIENVCNEQLAEGLKKKGFIVDKPWESCYWLWRK